MFFSNIFREVTRLLEKMVKVCEYKRKFVSLHPKVNQSKQNEQEISQEEVEAFMERAMESDAVEEDTYENIKKMLNFSDITV